MGIKKYNQDINVYEASKERISYTLKISQQTLSEHLKNLEKKDFIKIDYIHTEKGYLKSIYRV